MARTRTSPSDVAASNASGDNSGSSTAASSRPKRVRTGCLTCRERHLKCDEGLPECVNCQKSNRECKRGVRLNFIDTTVRGPPITPPASEDWDVSFQDESREIASEYEGGAQRYSIPAEEAPVKSDRDFDFSSSMIEAPIMSHSQLPAAPVTGQQQYPSNNVDLFPTTLTVSGASKAAHQRQNSSSSESGFANNGMGTASITYVNGEQTLTPPGETREILNNADELLYMQVFVEEVAIWMDSMDPYKHVCS